MGGGDGLEQALVELQEPASGCGSTVPGTVRRPRRRSSRTPSRRPTRSPTRALAEDDAKLLDELGDLLFQTVFLALLLEERGSGDLAEVARGIREADPPPSARLRRRELETPAAVKGRWEELKREQEEQESSTTSPSSCSTPARSQRPEEARRPPGSTTRSPTARSATSTTSPREPPERAAETEPDAHVFDELGDVSSPQQRLATSGRRPRACAPRGEPALRRACGARGGARRRGGRDWESLPLEEQDRYFDRAKEGIR